MKAGQSYYVELLQKVGTGGGHTAVAWAMQGVDSSSVQNWATPSHGAVAAQSSSLSNSYPASNLIDGNAETFNHTGNTAGSSVQVDLGRDRIVDSVELINRYSSQNRLSNFRVSILNSVDSVIAFQDYYLASGNVQGALRWQLPEAVIGRKVKVQLLGLNRNHNHYLHLAELNVWGRTSSNESERGLRTLIPPDVMSSYVPTLTDDADDNGYKDTWQNAYGFSAGYQAGDRNPLAAPSSLVCQTTPPGGFAARLPRRKPATTASGSPTRRVPSCGFPPCQEVGFTNSGSVPCPPS